MTEPTPFDQLPLDPPAPRRRFDPAEIVWFVMLLAFVIFVSAIRVMTFRNYFNRGRAYVWENYRELRHVLPGDGSLLMWLVYFGILVAFLGGGAAMLWLSLKRPEEPVSGPADPSRLPRMLAAAAVLVVIGAVLAFWSGPRDDVTGAELADQGDVNYQALPASCAEFFDREADVRSGKLREGQAEQTAAAECKTAVPTQWPTIEPAVRKIN
jgi:hypothetical protein